MKARLGGYTLVEALIVVAVTSTLFIGVTAIFSNSRHNVEFNQAKVDIETKIRGYTNEVSNGVFAGSSTHRCDRHASTQRPHLISGSSTDSKEKCIYLGKAVLAIDGSDRLRIYDVLGLRNIYSGGTRTTNFPTTVVDAMPEAAGSVAGAGALTFLFQEEYVLPASLVVEYARAGSTTANILKIYTNLASGNSSTRGLDTYSHAYTAQSSHLTNGTLRDCLRELNPCGTLLDIKTTGWDLCVRNSDNSRRAKINVKPTFSGVVTTVTDGQC